MPAKDGTITPRDLFAAAALTGILADRMNLEDEDCPSAWVWAFQLADAMMHQRNQPRCYIDDNGWVRSTVEEE